MKYTKDEIANARGQLLKLLKPGQAVYTVLRHVSSSGMARDIDVYAIGKDRRPEYLSYSVAVVLGYPVPKDGIRVSGCGMDMGFSLVYNLGATLWPKGTKKPHGTRNGEPDSAGGYALKQEWL